VSGVLAVISRDQRPVRAEALDGLMATYEAIRGAGRRDQAAAADFAQIAKIDSDAAQRPGIERGLSGFVASCGVVHGSASLLETALTALDGQFGLIRYDARSGALCVATDPFGLQALFLAERDGLTFISSSSLVLARHLNAEIDPLGLAVLALSGRQSGPITHWRGIERIGPATELTFTRGSSRRSTYWLPQADEATARLAFGTVVDHLIEVATDIIRRHLGDRPRIWADLTGGFDSRLLNLLLDRAGVDAMRNTVGLPGSPDVRLGEAVARTAGWPWTHFATEPDWPERILGCLPQTIGWSDGRLPVLHLSHVLRVHERQGFRYRGHVCASGGEFVSGRPWLQEFFRAGRTTQVNYDNLIDMRLLSSFPAVMVTPRLRSDVHEYFRKVLEERAAPYIAEPNTRQLDVLYAFRGASWEGAFMGAGGRHLLTQLPFYFKDVFTAVFSIPYGHRRRGRLQRAMIERLSPRIAALPTRGGGPAAPLRPRNALAAAPYFASLGKRAMRELARQRLGVRLPVRATPEGPAISEARRVALRELALLPDTLASSFLYEPGFLEQLLRADGEPHEPDDHRVDRIATVELIARS
jgi:hypothetical protein